MVIWKIWRRLFERNILSTATKNFFSWSSSSLSVASSLQASPTSSRSKKYFQLFLLDKEYWWHMDDRIRVSHQSLLLSTGWWSPWQPSDTETSSPRHLSARFDDAYWTLDPLLPWFETLYQLVGSLCAVAGVLVLSLPIPIIAQVSFNLFLCKQDSLIGAPLFLEFWGFPYGDKQEKQVRNKNLSFKTLQLIWKGLMLLDKH